jgi:hypothetical protein
MGLAMDRDVAKGRTGAESDWRRNVVACLAAFIGGLAVFFLAVILIDPFDSGRFPTFMPSGSPDDRAPTINISRGRDPRFDSVLLGSSRGVLMRSVRRDGGAGRHRARADDLSALVRAASIERQSHHPCD